MGMHLARDFQFPALGRDFQLIVGSLTVIGAAASFEVARADQTVETAHFLREGFVRGAGPGLWWRDDPGHSLTIVHLMGAALRPDFAVLGAAFLGCLVLVASLDEVWQLRPLGAVAPWLAVVGLIAAFGPLLPPPRSIILLTVRGHHVAAEIAGHSATISRGALAKAVIVPVSRRRNGSAFDVALAAKHGRPVLVFSCGSHADARAVAFLVNKWVSGTSRCQSTSKSDSNAVLEATGSQ